GNDEPRRPAVALQRFRPVLSAGVLPAGAGLRLLAVEQEEIRSGGQLHPRRRGPAMALERDPKSGYLTTGHEWNGIKELNTPVPRIVFFFLALAFAFSVGYWILMPAWPVGTTYTKGVLGLDQRAIVTASVKEAAMDRAVWADQIAKKSFA